MLRDMYWNVMLMMNNWWFRVVIYKKDSDRKFFFEYLIMVGNVLGGWMERLNEEGKFLCYLIFEEVLLIELEGNKDVKFIVKFVKVD